ncbi:MAG: thioredoxin domain-containing protein [Gemmatimonadaceae bacterium]
MRSHVTIVEAGVRVLAATVVIFSIACRESGDSSRRAASADAPAPTPTDSGAVKAHAQSTRSVVVNGIDLGAIGYDKGSPLAPIVIVEFSDFGCPYCAEFARETFPAIDSEFVRPGKVYFKYVPFVIGMFPNALQAARASECAGEQNRFWVMYDRLFSAQPEWKAERSPDALFVRYAASAGLDKSRFAACYARAETHRGTMWANAAAEKLGVRVTPSFIVNGRPVEGALPLADFRRLLTNSGR